MPDWPTDLGARDPRSYATGEPDPARNAPKPPRAPVDEVTRRRRAQQRVARMTQAPFVAYLTKPDQRGRLYRIDRLAALQWRCEIHIGAELHRSGVVYTRIHVQRMRREFQREVEALTADGWCLVPETP